MLCKINYIYLKNETNYLPKRNIKPKYNLVFILYEVLKIYKLLEWLNYAEHSINSREPSVAYIRNYKGVADKCCS